MADSWERVKQLFHEAAARPAAERGTYLDDACNGDDDVRTEVEALLESHDSVGELMASPTVNAGRYATLGESDESCLWDGPGTQIGAYTLLELIGEGGFGAVFLARQDEPIRRRVALKVIKLGMDTRRVIARFEAERQALALMEHPNIARVLDAGASDAGRPYFVMEFVDGIPITEYCDTRGLSLRERVELFVPLCHAIQHAHQKGIIHRDLKPSNVMIAVRDGKPVPKVIDFGIAKATAPDLIGESDMTVHAPFVGTPAYMSPEQSDVGSTDIDTRSDVYALGALLHELLIGAPPFDVNRLRCLSYTEIQRVIREEDPPRLSVRAQSVTKLQANERGTDPPALARRLRGDLECIVATALAKNRDERYQTARELAEDVQRYLAGEAVRATPPRLVYQIRKFVTRHRPAVAMTLLALVSLVSVITAVTWGLFEVAEQRDQAESARLGEKHLRRQAEGQRDRANAVTDLLLETLSLADPEVTLSSDVTLHALLDLAAAKIGPGFEHAPDAEADVRTIIGRAYYSLGYPEAAEPHLRRALQLRDTLPGTSPNDLYTTLWPLAQVAYELGRDDAMPLWTRTTHFGLTLLAKVDDQLESAHRSLLEAILASDPQNAQAAFTSAVDAAQRSVGPGDPVWRVIADFFFNDGYLAQMHRHDLSEACLREALRIHRNELPITHPQRAHTLETLVMLLAETGRHAEAEGLARELIDVRAQVLSADHWQIAAAEALLGGTLVAQSRFIEARDLLLASRDVLTAARGPEAEYYTEVALVALVDLYDALDDTAKAAVYRDQLITFLATAAWPPMWPSARTAIGPEHARLSNLLDDLHRLVTDQDLSTRQRNDAVKETLSDLRTETQQLEQHEPLSAVVARLLAQWADFGYMSLTPDARRMMLTETLRVLSAHQDDIPTDFATAMSHLAFITANEGDLERGESMAAEAWTLLRESEGDESGLTALARTKLGRVLLEQARYAEAEPHLIGPLPLLVDQIGERAEDTVEVRELIITLYRRWNRPEAARPYAVRAIALARERARASDAGSKDLGRYARLLLDVVPEDLRDPEEALEAAEAAMAASDSDDPYLLYTLALARFQTHDPAGAVEAQRQAIALLSDRGGNWRRAIFEQRLREYEAPLADKR